MELLNTQKANWMIQDEENGNIKKEENHTFITAMVTLGMPSKDCAYTGICRIDPEESRETPIGKCSGLARISLKVKNQLFFQFLKDQMPPVIIKRHFGSGYFIIIEAYKTPKFLCEAFKKSALIICQGVYPLKEQIGSYEVALDTSGE